MSEDGTSALINIARNLEGIFWIFRFVDDVAVWQSKRRRIFFKKFIFARIIFWFIDNTVFDTEFLSGVILKEKCGSIPRERGKRSQRLKMAMVIVLPSPEKGEREQKSKEQPHLAPYCISLGNVEVSSPEEVVC